MKYAPKILIPWEIHITVLYPLNRGIKGFSWVSSFNISSDLDSDFSELDPLVHVANTNKNELKVIEKDVE